MKEALRFIKERSLSEFIQKKILLKFAKRREQSAAQAFAANTEDEEKRLRWHRLLDRVDQKNYTSRHTRVGEKVLKLFFPDKDFVYYARGSSGLIFVCRSEPSRVYKVATLNTRGAPSYPDFDFPEAHITYFEEEVKKIRALSDSGVTPVFYGTAGFEGFEEHYLDTAIPVIVMERVFFDDNWRMKLPLDKINELIRELFVFVQERNLLLGDTEVVYEPSSDKLRIVDLGGITIKDSPHYDSYEQFYDKVMARARNRKR